MRAGSSETSTGAPSDEDSEKLVNAYIWRKGHQSLQLALPLGSQPHVQHAEDAIQSAACGMSTMLYAQHTNLFKSRNETLPALPNCFDPFSHVAIAAGSGSESEAASTRGIRELSGGDWYQMSVGLPSTNNLPGGSRASRGADITQYLQYGIPQGMQQDTAHSLHHLHVPPDNHLLHLSVQREMQPRHGFEHGNVFPGMHRSCLNTQQGMCHITHPATHEAGFEHANVHPSCFNTQQRIHESSMPLPCKFPYHDHQMSHDHQIPLPDIYQSADTRHDMGVYENQQMNQMGVTSYATYMTNRQQADYADCGADVVRVPQILAMPGRSSNLLPVAYNSDSYTIKNNNYNISDAVNTNGMHMQHVRGSQYWSTLREPSIDGPQFNPAFEHGRRDEGRDGRCGGDRHSQHGATHGAQDNMMGWDFDWFDPSYEQPSKTIY